METRSLLAVGTAVCLATWLVPSTAAADAVRCQRAVAKASSAHVQARARALLVAAAVSADVEARPLSIEDTFVSVLRGAGLGGG